MPPPSPIIIKANNGKTENNKKSSSSSPRKIESLMKYLFERDDSKSFINNGLSVVSVGDDSGGKDDDDNDECGIQLDINELSRREEKMLSSSSKEDEEEEEEFLNDYEIAFIDRSKFIIPEFGKFNTFVGRALDKYIKSHLNEYEIMKHTNILPSIYIAIFLLDIVISEKSNKYNDEDTNSYHSSYLQTLPSLEALRQHLPIFWSDGELKELQESVVKSKILQRKKEWAEEYNMILEAIREEQKEGPKSSDNANDEKLDLLFVDLDLWYWARCIVTSRAFDDNMNMKEKEKTTTKGSDECLIPYIDMLNHNSNIDEIDDDDDDDDDDDNDVIVCNWNIDKEGFHLKLPTTFISKGNRKKKIEISYGRCCNSHFLMNYGFCILDDKNQLCLEQVILPIKFMPHQASPSSTHLDLQNQLWNTGDSVTSSTDYDDLNNNDNTQNKSIIPLTHNIPLSIGGDSNPEPMKSVLSLCRILSTNDKEEINKMKQRCIRRREEGEKQLDNDYNKNFLHATSLCRIPFSLNNEITAMKLLQQQIMNVLQEQYDTTIDEDEDMLEEMIRQQEEGNNSINLNKKNAIILRRGEKIVLKHYYNVAYICLQFLLSQQHAEREEESYFMEEEDGEYQKLLNELLINEQNAILQFRDS